MSQTIMLQPPRRYGSTSRPLGAKWATAVYLYSAGAYHYIYREVLTPRHSVDTTIPHSLLMGAG